MIQLQNIQLLRGGKSLLNDAQLSLHAGQSYGLVGRHGAGKTSLFKLLLGELQPDAGEMQLPPNLRLTHMAQELGDISRTAIDHVLDGDQPFRQAETAIAKAQQEQDDHGLARAWADYDQLSGYTALNRAQQLLQGLGFAEADWAQPVASFSGGWRVRLNLAQALMCPSDLLLLDEPTNHLDAETVAWLENYLKSYSGTIILITHDRYFLNNITEWILELDRGKGIPYEGNYTSWLTQKQKRIELESKEDNSRLKRLNSELDWISASPKARQAKSKARIKSYENLKNKEVKESTGEPQIIIPKAPRLGDMVIDINGISKSYKEKLLIEDVSFRLPPGGIVGIIGANGAGKTTLFRMLSGLEEADNGEIKMGETVVMGYVDQSRDTLEDSKTVWEEISEGNDIIDVNSTIIHSRAYVSAFNFKGSDQQKVVGQLSGGERNRVHLAKVLKSGAN